MNQNLQALRLSVRNAVQDERLTSDDVLREIHSAMESLAVDLKAKATKAENVANGVKLYGSPLSSFDGMSDYNRLDDISARGSWGDGIIYGGSGTDTISF